MQIRSEYTSLQNGNYRQSHTHHITECLHEEDPVKKPEGSMGALSDASVSQSRAVEFSKDGDSYQMSGQAAMEKKTGKSGVGLIKGFWDALGDEDEGGQQNMMASLRESLLSGIHGAAASVKTMFHHQVTEKIQNLRERLKTGAGSAFKRFGRGKDAFAALTDGQMPSGRGKADDKRKNSSGQVTSAQGEENVPMKVLKHSHLMDSYSKRGEYCQLNDNLTYQKPGSRPKRQRSE